MIDFYKHFKLKFMVIIVLQQSILGTYFFFQNPSFIHVPEPIMAIHTVSRIMVMSY